MNIIVNGGSKGIGKEIALFLAKDADNKIIITGRNSTSLEKVAAKCKHGNISFITLDLSTLGEEIDNIKHQVLSLFEKIDVLINNAGFLVVEEFMKISAKNARLVMETNFFGPATLIRMLVPLMKEGSHIVNISSMGGFQGSVKYKGLAYYSSSKAALATLTECLAVELTDRGISANCLALGSVQTEMFETAFKGLRAPVEPESMSEFISWFALNGHKFFNGKILPVALGNP